MSHDVSRPLPSARHALTILTITAGQLVLVAAIGAPLVLILIHTARAGGERAIDPALLAALPRTLWIAATAAAMATVLAIPASIVLGGAGRRSAVCGALTGLVLLPLLTPSHVHVYLWQRLREAFAEPGDVGPIASIVTGWFGVAWVTACWLWPIPALLLAAGWRREGGQVYEVAQFDLSRWRARFLAIRASLQPYAAAGAAIVFVLSCVEYTLPHLSIVPTYATELFLMVEQRRVSPAALMWQAWPLMLPAVGLVALGSWLAGRVRSEATGEAATAATAGVGSTLATLAVLALTFGLPLGYGVSLLSAPPAMLEALRVFGPEWLSSLESAGVVSAGIFVCVLSVTATHVRRAARVGWLAIAMLAAATPAALYGVAMIELFGLAEPLRVIQDDTPLVWWLASAARVAFIGLLAATIGGGPAEASAEELARADGLRAWERVWYVRWSMRWPALLAASLAAGLVSMSEVAVSTLVRPPGVGAIAVSLLNQMHFGRQDAVIASSLLMLIPAAIAAGLLAIALRVRGGAS